MTTYKVMVIELAGREFEVEAEDPQGAIKEVQQKLQETNGELPPSVTIDIISPMLWPIIKKSTLITQLDTKITKIH